MPKDRGAAGTTTGNDKHEACVRGGDTVQGGGSVLQLQRIRTRRAQLYEAARDAGQQGGERPALRDQQQRQIIRQVVRQLPDGQP